MTRYVPRPYQPSITNHILTHPRCNVFAGMGVGKTPATLEAIATLLLLGEVERVLVLAPKRVAVSTWAGEIETFNESFGHMTLAVAVGTDAERRAAVESGAQIVTLNYENLTWLVENYGATWPFQMVVADEASKLKSLRVSIQTSKKGKQFLTGQGGSRAKSLARVAFTRVKRFVNLTGTPAANGLQDLWALCFLCDTGQRLGSSFTAFSHRWFRSRPGSDPQKMQIEPLPFADEQIRGAIRDISIAIEARDHFDLPPLIENDIKVMLPPAKMKLYKQMEKELFIELDGKPIEAFSAAAMTQKCLAEGSLVLSHRGWVPIESITNQDALWDGVEWVRSEGAVCNGLKEVVDCWGTKMTADHLILTTQGWVESGKVLASAVQDQRYDRAEVRIPDDHRQSAFDPEGWKVAGRLARPVRLWQDRSRPGLLPKREHTGCPEILRVQKGGNVFGRVGDSRYEQAPSLRTMAGGHSAVHEQKLQRLGKLWRAGHRGVRTLVEFVRGFLAGHGSDLRAGTAIGAARERRALFPGQLQVGHSIGTSKQPTDQRPHPNTAWGNDSSTGGPRVQLDHGNIAATSPTQLGTGKIVSTSDAETAQVYDIVNCGHRHRFTVKGANGEIFLAHNCLQIASGAAYTDDKGTWTLVHDEKIDALHSVVEEAAGMPVLVFYHFKSDLARILKAFPKAEHLGSDPKTIERWNKGEIPMLVAHPQSAGHGLSLQHGSNIMCFFSSNWSLEADAQAQERAGPTRQAQSGYKRPVFVHRLVAAGTLEEVVVRRLRTKASVQDALLEAMKIAR